MAPAGWDRQWADCILWLFSCVSDSSILPDFVEEFLKGDVDILVGRVIWKDLQGVEIAIQKYMCGRACPVWANYSQGEDMWPTSYKSVCFRVCG